MAVEYLKVFADLEDQQLEFWLSQDEKGLEKELTDTERDIEGILQKIESLQEQKEQREAEESEDERIVQLEKSKAEAGLKLELIKTKLTELKEGEK